MWGGPFLLRAHLLASRRPSLHRCRKLSASQARRRVTSMGLSPSTSCASHPSAARRAARNSSPLRTPICGGGERLTKKHVHEANSRQRWTCADDSAAFLRRIGNYAAPTKVRQTQGTMCPSFPLACYTRDENKSMTCWLRRRHTCSERRPDIRPSSRRSTRACVPPSCSVLAKLGSRPPPLHRRRTMLAAQTRHEQSNLQTVGRHRRRSCSAVVT